MTNSKLLAKLLSSYDSDILQPTEVADRIVAMLLDSADTETEIQMQVGDFPEEVKRALYELLESIRGSHYSYWRFYFGTGSHWADPAKLERICESIGVIR